MPVRRVAKRRAAVEREEDSRQAFAEQAAELQASVDALNDQYNEHEAEVAQVSRLLRGGRRRMDERVLGAARWPRRAVLCCAVARRHATVEHQAPPTTTTTTTTTHPHTHTPPTPQTSLPSPTLPLQGRLFAKTLESVAAEQRLRLSPEERNSSQFYASVPASTLDHQDKMSMLDLPSMWRDPAAKKTGLNKFVTEQHGVADVTGACTGAARPLPSPGHGGMCAEVGRAGRVGAWGVKRSNIAPHLYPALAAALVLPSPLCALYLPAGCRGFEYFISKGQNHGGESNIGISIQ